MYKRYRGLLAVMLALTLLICTVPITPAEVKAADMPAGDYLNVILTNSGSTSSSLVNNSDFDQSIIMMRNTGGNQRGYFELYDSESRLGNINIGETQDLVGGYNSDEILAWSPKQTITYNGYYTFLLAGASGSTCKLGNYKSEGGKGTEAVISGIHMWRGQKFRHVTGQVGSGIEAALPQHMNYASALGSNFGYDEWGNGGGNLGGSYVNHKHERSVAIGYNGGMSAVLLPDGKYAVAAGGGAGLITSFKRTVDSGSSALDTRITCLQGGDADATDSFTHPQHGVIEFLIATGNQCYTGNCTNEWNYYGPGITISTRNMYYLGICYPEVGTGVVPLAGGGIGCAMGGVSGIGAYNSGGYLTPAETDYRISLNKGSHSGVGYAKIRCDSKILNIPNPTRTGYVFNGWECSGNVTAKRNAGGGSYEIKVMQSGATITAKWKPISYKIRYHKGESDTTATPPADTTIKFDQNVTYSQAGQLSGRSYAVNFYRNLPAFVPAPETCTITDHVISGNLQCANTWNILGSLATMGSTSTVPPNYASQQDKVIRATAQWQPKTITNFATGTMEGYTLKGWYTQPTGGTKVTSLTINPATSAYTTSLYAQWEGIKYKVIYKAGDGGSGSDVTETWKFSAPHDLYNNVPQLTGAGGNPHFTKDGYYIDYWIFSATGDRNTAYDVGNIVTRTGYNGATAKGIVKTYSHGNLIQPRKNGCVVTLTAHWAPIKYKVQYNNDTTIVEGKGYSTSTGTFTTDDFLYGEVYPFANFNPTRSNKFGASTFLGYGYNNGDTTKTIKYYVDGKSLAKYRNMGAKTSITATDFTGLKTIAGTSQYDYFHWLNPGNIQTFNIYAVWDDCPGITPIDLQWGGNTTDANSIITYDKQSNSSTHSAKMSEFFILNNSNNKSTVWDREDPVDTITSNMKDRYYIDGFAALNIGQQKTYDNGTVEPTSYELKYTVVDSNENKYQVSKKLYVGNLANIMVGGSALQQ